jgi:2-polyprenyl-3-methyl-5-hydroxy-6-metoxy-1,4-benzoquinol methylase
LTNVDIYKPYVDYLQTQKFDAQVAEFVYKDVVLWLAEQPEGEYDVLLLIDLLEHFERVRAEFVVRLCKYVARRKIIVFSPLGKCPQAAYDGNGYQRHLSTWTSAGLEALGFQVEVLEAFHKHFDPPVDAGWAVMEVGK